jgi:hypothetical protein
MFVTIPSMKNQKKKTTEGAEERGKIKTSKQDSALFRFFRGIILFVGTPRRQKSL